MIQCTKLCFYRKISSSVCSVDNFEVMLAFHTEICFFFTCVISAVDDGSHGETEGDAELRSRGTSTSFKQKNHTLLILITTQVFAPNLTNSGNKLIFTTNIVWVSIRRQSLANSCTVQRDFNGYFLISRTSFRHFLVSTF